MKASEQLVAEHQAIKLMLSILEQICQRLESGRDVDTQHLERILEFIKVFADKCHHGKEEDLLFPALEEFGIPRAGGPIGVMLVEHDTGRNYVRGMTEAVARYKAGDRQAAAQLVENARNYISLLTQHIAKEDNILYPMGDAHLTEKKQEKLLAEFERIERERIGVGKHEEFHQLLEHLRRIYLQ